MWCPLRGRIFSFCTARSNSAVSLRGPSGPWQSVFCLSLRGGGADVAIRTLGSWFHKGSACTGYGLPRLLRSLAMTDVVDGLRLGFDFPCHCEERSDVAIRSFGSWFHKGSACKGMRIATPPAEARNDNRDTIILPSSFSLTPPSVSPAEPYRQTCRSCRRGSGRWGSGRWKAPGPPRPWARPSGRPADTGS